MTKLKAAIDSYHAYQQLVKDTQNKMSEIEATFKDFIKYKLDEIAQTICTREDLYNGFEFNPTSYKIDTDGLSFSIILQPALGSRNEFIDIKYCVKTDDLYVNAYDRSVVNQSASSLMRVSYKSIAAIHELITSALNEPISKK